MLPLFKQRRVKMITTTIICLFIGLIIFQWKRIVPIDEVELDIVITKEEQTSWGYDDV
tara:strand:- start:353 stop:526 length:174 start_codon:yes stop_codon:yes gene_type:complete